MTMNTLPKFVNTITAGAAVITAATTAASLYTGQAEGSVIEILGAVSTDTAACNVSIFMVDTASTSYQIGCIAVPAGSGTDGTNPAIDLLNTTDMPQLAKNTFSKPIINLPASWSLEAEVDTLSATREVTVFAGTRDY
jgi:hypothetical protein